MKERSQVQPVNPAIGAASAMLADTMTFWADQVVAQQRFASAVLDSCMQWGKEVEAGLAQAMQVPGAQAHQVTADSAGVTLTTLDPSPAGIMNTFAGTANAMFQAWANAVEHEVQDAQATLSSTPPSLKSNAQPGAARGH